MHDQRPVCFLLRYLQLQSIGVDVAYRRGHDGRDHHHLVRAPGLYDRLKDRPIVIMINIRITISFKGQIQPTQTELRHVVSSTPKNRGPQEL